MSKSMTGWWRLSSDTLPAGSLQSRYSWRYIHKRECYTRVRDGGATGA